MPDTKQESASPKSILIVLMGSLGDVVRGMALVPAIKQALPQVRITWLVEPNCEPIVKLNPGVDRVIIFNRKLSVVAIPALLRELKKEHFDIVLDLQRHFKSGFFSWLSAAPRRIGFHRHDSKEFNWLFQTETIAEHGDGLAKTEHYLEFLKPLKIAKPGRLTFGLRPSGKSGNLGVLKQGGERFVVFILGSSWISKNWQLQGYSQLLDFICANSNYRVLLCGDKSQTERAQRLLEGVWRERLVDCTGKTSLEELVTIISKSTACVGPDSGPAHIASALGVPHVTLFGPTSAERVAPWENQHLSLASTIGCSPCYRRKCPGLRGLCMRSLSAEMVWERLGPLLRA